MREGGCFAVVAFDMFIEHPYKYIMKYRSFVKAKEWSAWRRSLYPLLRLPLSPHASSARL